MARIFPSILFLQFICIIEFVECAKILFTFYHDRGSHFGSMLPMMERLAIQGHSVHVLDTIFHSDKSNLIRHIRATLPQEDEELEARIAFQEFFWEETDSSVTLPEFFGHGDNLLGQLIVDEKHSAKNIPAAKFICFRALHNFVNNSLQFGQITEYSPTVGSNTPKESFFVVAHNLESNCEQFCGFHGLDGWTSTNGRFA